MRRCRKDFSARPVFLTVEDTEGFYEGYCNQTLWPLFHYFPALVSFDEGPWATYELINEVFCDAVLEEAGPDGGDESGTKRDGSVIGNMGGRKRDGSVIGNMGKQKSRLT